MTKEYGYCALLLLFSIGAFADPAPHLDQSTGDSCLLSGGSYPVGSIVMTQKKEKIECKIYDAIIPKSMDRLERGYTYWAQYPAPTENKNKPQGNSIESISKQIDRHPPIDFLLTNKI